MVEFPSTPEDHDRDRLRPPVPLKLSSLWLSHTIVDLHDSLSSLENLGAICRQLVPNLRADSYIDHDSRLAVDLLARSNEIGALLRKARTDTQQLQLSFDTFRCYQLFLHLIIHCQLLAGSMMIFDDFADDFEELTGYAERWLCATSSLVPGSFTYAPTITFAQPLWYTAVHCRDPHIRRRAISTLQRYHRNECGLDTWCAAHVACRLVEIEENFGDIKSALDVPEQCRVLLQGFECINGAPHFRYMYARGSNHDGIFHCPVSIPADFSGVMEMKRPPHDVEHLNKLLALATQADCKTALRGYISPIYYDGDIVQVVVS
jgi:hypothetical protein